MPDWAKRDGRWVNIDGIPCWVVEDLTGIQEREMRIAARQNVAHRRAPARREWLRMLLTAPYLLGSVVYGLVICVLGLLVIAAFVLIGLWAVANPPMPFVLGAITLGLVAWMAIDEASRKRKRS